MSAGTLARSRDASGGPPPMDPRVRDRRNAVARDQGRKRLRRLLVLMAVVSVGAAAGLIVRSPLLDVDRVEVRGASRSGVGAVRDAAGIQAGRSMISVDEDAARGRVTRVAWVDQATVHLRWPGTVVIDVTERIPVAVAGEGRDAVLLDRTGRVLARAQDAPGVRTSRLPVVAATGVEPGQRVGTRRTQLVSVLADMTPELRSQVDRAWWGKSGIVVRLDDGITVDWGDDHRTANKAEAVLALLEQADRPTIDRIDVSVPTAAALTRKAGGTAGGGP